MESGPGCRAAEGSQYGRRHAGVAAVLHGRYVGRSAWNQATSFGAMPLFPVRRYRRHDHGLVPDYKARLARHPKMSGLAWA